MRLLVMLFAFLPRSLQAAALAVILLAAYGFARLLAWAVEMLR